MKADVSFDSPYWHLDHEKFETSPNIALSQVGEVALIAPHLIAAVDNITIERTPHHHE
jgi:hypothetical protein